MHPLTKLYVRRMFSQKLIYIFFACFLTASFFYAFLISTPQMEEMLNIDIRTVGRENFPEFMMRFYVGTVGILFQVFLLTLYICEKDRIKLIFQPLLHGEERRRVMQSKIWVAAGMSMLFVLLIAIINYGAAFMRWGNGIFETEAVTRTGAKYLLSGIYMSCIAIGIIALCLYTRSTWKTITASILYMLADGWICSSGILPLQRIWIGYPSNLAMFAYEYGRIPVREMIWGIAVMMVYGAVFYKISLYKIERIDF